MRYSNYVSFALALAGATPAVSATKEPDLPDKEMLKMMEFLREMEMIKQLDLMRDMHQVDTVGVQAKDGAPRKAAPPIKKETSK